jgi:hypothetical protein
MVRVVHFAGLSAGQLKVNKNVKHVPFIAYVQCYLLMMGKKQAQNMER